MLRILIHRAYKCYKKFTIQQMLEFKITLLRALQGLCSYRFIKGTFINLKYMCLLITKNPALLQTVFYRTVRVSDTSISKFFLICDLNLDTKEVFPLLRCQCKFSEIIPCLAQGEHRIHSHPSANLNMIFCKNLPFYGPVIS